jgi:hypothetical protein
MVDALNSACVPVYSDASETKICGPDPFLATNADIPECPPGPYRPSPVQLYPQRPALAPSPPSPTPSQKPAIIGASVAVVALLAACAAGGLFVWRRHLRGRLHPPTVPVAAPIGTVRSSSWEDLDLPCYGRPHYLLQLYQCLIAPFEYAGTIVVFRFAHGHP